MTLPFIYKKKIKQCRRDTAAAALFMLPSLTGITLFVLLPFAETLRRSFTNALGTKAVGIENYISVLQNEAFLLAAKNTIRFICVCVPLLICLSTVLALLVRRAGSSARGFKTVLLLPLAIPVASIALFWQLLFSQNGIINGALQSLGGSGVDFMTSNAAFWVLIATYLWKNGGYDMILILSGLDNIGQSQYEAASVDGANALQSFRYITLPGLKQTLFLTLVLSVLNTFKVFREAYLVAGAYPHKSIYLLQHLFNNWFASLDLPRLTACAVMVAAVLLIFILILQYMWRDKSE